ncbi:hypothetical protein K523DRAFT_404297 [Schizophyllum commune Tattone D]|nr:hypothetical protein K523DRAFT_404297 [Schizophyllum commune Tattone D]
MADTQDPPASAGTKTFGIHKPDSPYRPGAQQPRETKRRGYEDKYEDDALGEELGDDARIWRVMLDEGRASDAAMLQRFRDHLDVDLVFAGLFSAVLTTFVAQTSQLSSDASDTTIALLLELIAIQRAWASNSRVDGVASYTLPPSTPSPSPWINRCWFLSLIFSLLAAFGAVVVRQWLQEYESDITGPPKRRALVRHYRRVGLEKYKVHLIVPILPMLLHVSLLLFFVGLTLYVRQSDRSMSNGIIALTVAIYLVYLGTNLMPVIRPQCPYRSPLSTGAHWANALVALLCALLPASFRMKALLLFFLRNLSSTASHTVELQLGRALATLRRQLQSYREALKNSWKEVFKAPDAHEWAAVLNSSDTMIPDSLGSMAQASSDLSVTPLVVQASSSHPIDHTHFGDREFEDPRYKELLHHCILPWFINVLSTRRTVFDWEPGRENELQRMACVLLLVPMEHHRRDHNTVLWSEFNTDQYCACILRVLQSLTSALLDLPKAPTTTTTTDVATLSMTLLALGNRLRNLDCKSKFLRNGALFDAIAAAYSSLPNPHSLAVLRLRPVIWHHTLYYLLLKARPLNDAAHFAITLWRSAYSEAPFPDGGDRRKEHLATLPHLSLQEWLYLHPDRSEMVAIIMYRLLCPQSLKSHKFLRLARELTHASRLHTACHAIDLFVKEDSADGDAAFDLLVAHFTGLLFATLGYESINSALRVIGHSRVSAIFKSAFLIRPVLSLAKFLKADERLPAPFAVSLLCFFVKLVMAVKATDHQDRQLAILDVLHALDHHSKEYHDALTEEFPIEYLWPAVEVILGDPRLAVLEFWNGIVALLATQLSKSMTSKAALSDLPAYDMTWCLSLDALCTARANTNQVGPKIPDASHKLRSSLLSLDSKYHETWKSELILRLKQQWIPLAVALALKSTHGCNRLAEWVDDLPALVQDPNSGLKANVPFQARFGEDLDWYRHFTSNPDKHIHAPVRHGNWVLHISDLVSFEEAVERMQKTDVERPAVEARRSSRGDGAEVDANNDAENAGRVHGGLANQGGAERTENETADRLRTLGAWVSTSFKSVRPFLGAINRDMIRRPSSFALGVRDVDTDLERIAGTSVARDSGGAERAQDDAQAQEDAQARDDEQSHDDERARDGEQDQDSSQAQEDAHAQGDERSQAEEVPHVQCGKSPDEAVGSDAHEDVEYGGTTSARGLLMPDGEGSRIMATSRVMKESRLMTTSKCGAASMVKPESMVRPESMIRPESLLEATSMVGTAGTVRTASRLEPARRIRTARRVRRTRSHMPRRRRRRWRRRFVHTMTRQTKASTSARGGAWDQRWRQYLGINSREELGRSVSEGAGELRPRGRRRAARAGGAGRRSGTSDERESNEGLDYRSTYRAQRLLIPDVYALEI